MGIIQAFSGALGGSLADQWKDFLTIPKNIAATAALVPATPNGKNLERGSNIRSSENIITKGTKIFVPDGYGLLVVEDSKIIGYVEEQGGYIWDGDSIDSKSIFAGDTIREALLEQAWKRFKMGGTPSSQQNGIFVNTRELTGNKFGTRSEIYWDDAYLNTQAGALVRGIYTIRVENPILLIQQFVPSASILNGEEIDFSDPTSPLSQQLLNEVISVLASSFAKYANADGKATRISQIQQDAWEFSQVLAEEIERQYGWRTKRGLKIENAAIVSIAYDERTRTLLESVQRADALNGPRADANLKAAMASGIEAAGQNGGANALLGIGIAGNAIGINSLMSQAEQQKQCEETVADKRTRLRELKELYGEGLISENEYDQAKKKVLGI